MVGDKPKKNFFFFGVGGGGGGGGGGCALANTIWPSGHNVCGGDNCLHPN